MRAYLVGIVLVTICGTSAFGQANGFVEQIGFQKNYRPYGWTPVLINLTSTIGEPAEYQIQVRQEDLDRDRVIFRRDIVLNPNKQEKFWVYFMAQPRGLPDGSPTDLSKVLDVRLCTKSGKPLVHLKIQDPIQNLDPKTGGFISSSRGKRLVLAVSDGGSVPASRDFNDAIGLSEDVEMVTVSPFQLPENVIGYDAVDAVVWLDAQANQMTSGGSRRKAALTEYVRSGGRLVVCQPPERGKVEELADLLPVEVKDAAGDWLIDLRDRKDLRPLRDLARYKVEPPVSIADADGESQAINLLLKSQQQGWDRIEQRGAVKIAFAQPKPGAVGEEWIDWKGDRSEMSPWLVRHALGFGSVTWVAQDLGNPALIGRDSTGWPYVWDRVLGYRNTDMRVVEEYDSGPSGPKARFRQKAAATYASSNSIDIGGALLVGMEHTGRAGGLVFLAGVFFVGYWLVAGPVSYLVLAGKKRTHLSWSIFAVSALVATLLTVGVVRLVLRGEAELHHVSLVRALPAGAAEDGAPISRAIVDSRIGLYIPRDYSGDGAGAPVKLLENDPQALSYLTPFSIHPQHQTNTTEFPAYLKYEIPVRDNPLTGPVEVRVPYRSTLKKLQARWVGHMKAGIEVVVNPAAPTAGKRLLLVPTDRRRTAIDDKGAARQVPNGFINGLVANRAGTDLSHVWFAFHHPDATFGGVSGHDVVLYVPHWPDGMLIDLGRQYSGAERFQPPGSPVGAVVPGGSNKKSIRGILGGDFGWERYWYHNLRGTGMGDQLDDARAEYLRSFPILSLYDRLAPQKNDTANNAQDRNEILRRAARDWDCSDLVAAGQLVILARAGKPGFASDESPLPFPIEVEGDQVAGTGTTFYQFALPLDRGELGPASDAGQEPADGPERPAPAGDAAADASADATGVVR